jgi:hypothetical protein
MLLKEYLRTLAKQAGVEDLTEIEALTGSSAMSGLELSDEVISNINKGILTKEAALASPDIKKHFEKQHKGQYLGLMDTRHKNNIRNLVIAGKISQTKADEILGETDTLTRDDLIAKTISEIEFTKADDVKLIEETKKLNNEIATLKSTYESKLAEKDSNFKRYKEDFIIENDIVGRPLIDNIPGGKNFLTSGILKEIRDEYTLVVDDSRKILLRQKDSPESPIFVDNKEVTYESVITKKLEPFTKKSAGAGTEKVEPIIVEKQGETLADFHRLKAMANV